MSAVGNLYKQRAIWPDFQRKEINENHQRFILDKTFFSSYTKRNVFFSYEGRLTSIFFSMFLNLFELFSNSGLIAIASNEILDRF